MSEPLYRIRGWNENFENNRSRDLKRLEFAMLPNRLDSDAYAELLDHQNGAAHFGAWSGLVLIASRCAPRGTLVRDGGNPHTPQSLARISRIPAGFFEAAIPRLLAIGWLEEIAFIDNNLHDGAGISHSGAETSHDGALSRARENGREGNGREGNGREGNGREGNGREGKRTSSSVRSTEQVHDPGMAADKPIDDLQIARNWLADYPGAARLPGEPDVDIAGQCLAAVGGSIDALSRHLKEMNEKLMKPDRSWAWFPAVLRQRCGRAA